MATKDNPLVIQLLGEMRAEIKELRAEVATAMGFINGAKWVLGLVGTLIAMGLVKFGLGHAWKG